MPSLTELRAADGSGSLPAFAWPGGYQIIYIADDGATVCPKCANGEDFHESGDADGFRLEGWTIFYEGPDEICCHCNVVIESAYGDPDDCEDSDD
jgi:hypothetical protein